MAALRANRLTRLTAAEIVAALIAAIVIAVLGTGLGIAAVHVNDQPSQTPLQIIHPADGSGDQQFMLHRDRPYVP
jgi:hypothetical protein